MFLLSTVANAEPHWLLKPVQCGPQKELETLVERDGQKPLLAAVATAIFDDNGNLSKKELPIILFYNPTNKMYSLVEFNPEIQEACVISFGNGVDFNVMEWYYGDKKS